MRAYLAPISKAIAGFFGSALTALGASMADGDITRPEVIVALGAGFVVGGGLVYIAPKNSSIGQHVAEDGAFSITAALACVVVVLLFLGLISTLGWI